MKTRDLVTPLYCAVCGSDVNDAGCALPSGDCEFKADWDRTPVPKPNSLVEVLRIIGDRKFVTGHLEHTTDPSVSPGDSGQARQRRPKPEFRIQYHPITQHPWFLPLNSEAVQLCRILLLTTETYEYYRGGITLRLKPR